ncbi:MAG TPA: zinc-dependent metalloprotease [Mycobacteriales bacterium]|jgi:uncharacterized protein (DUF2342 family)|nr:zinc-dependent metalloprotease [Mycobacteriales bacterium]
MSDRHSSFVDWRFAQSTAALLGKSGPTCTPAQAAATVSQLRQLANVAIGHVTEVTGLDTGAGSNVRVVDRWDWVGVNAEGFNTVIAPTLRPRLRLPKLGSTSRAVSSATMGVQFGVVLALVSSRVLGQYEFFSAERGQLLLVAPNILAAERKLGVDPRDFRLWVCLHEVTHERQFTAVPWLRGHFLSELNGLLQAASPAAILRSAKLREKLSGLGALMTLVEGHAEYVMDAVGPAVIPSLEPIRTRFDARRRSGNPLQKLLRYALGVEHKMRQYVEGKRFVTEVVEAVGMTGFNTVWREPSTLPTKPELAEPRKWLERTQPAG